ncbi:hypothetical protein DCCM_0214 [Desulfocucumis palustris]|uniref:Uncharacterized protein n=1 Tax=Desulfocucumis palustris TaxID=1898651 RepID=A0A2L2X8W3_9FIRM|nr:hypothetical protein DCCM_0214 [Desulfocucumis palustris]
MDDYFLHQGFCDFSLNLKRRVFFYFISEPRQEFLLRGNIGKYIFPGVKPQFNISHLLFQGSLFLLNLTKLLFNIGEIDHFFPEQFQDTFLF